MARDALVDSCPPHIQLSCKQVSAVSVTSFTSFSVLLFSDATLQGGGLVDASIAGAEETSIEWENRESRSELYGRPLLPNENNLGFLVSCNHSRTTDICATTRLRMVWG